MRNLIVIVACISLVIATGCTTNSSQNKVYELGYTELHEIDMSEFTIEEFKDQIACDITAQCKFVLYGQGVCNPYRGYLIYSTAIGKVNEQHLFDEVKSNLESDIAAQRKLTGEQICIPSFPAEPLLFCGNDEVCVNAWEVMGEQEREILKLSRELGLME